MKKESGMHSITKSIGDAAKRIGPYKAILFFIFIAAMYGFIVYRISVLSSIAPDTSAVTVSSTKAPHIDPAVVQKINELQDNSVNVQTLFDQARQNPFQE